MVHFGATETTRSAQPACLPVSIYARVRIFSDRIIRARGSPPRGDLQASRGAGPFPSSTAELTLIRNRNLDSQLRFRLRFLSHRSHKEPSPWNQGREVPKFQCSICLVNGAWNTLVPLVPSVPWNEMEHLEADKNQRKPVRPFVLYSFRHTFLRAKENPVLTRGHWPGSPAPRRLASHPGTCIRPTTWSWMQFPGWVAQSWAQ